MTIRNTGTVPAQPIARHWIITDAEDKVQEVRGLGVVGHQPLLQPGESFQNTQRLRPADAGRHDAGSYQMIAEDGTHFDAEIPEFTLAIPRILH